MSMSTSDARKRMADDHAPDDDGTVAKRIGELLALAWDQGYRAHVHDRNPYREDA